MQSDDFEYGHLNPEPGGRRVRFPEVLRLRWPLLLMGAAALLRPLDRAFAGWINPDLPGPLDGWGLWCDAWSTRVLLVGAFLGLYLTLAVSRWRRGRTPLVAFLAGWIGVEVVVGILKRVVGRPRPIHPEGLGSEIRPLFDHFDLKSFPSGHSATAACAAIFVCCLTRSRPLRLAAGAYALMVALSRCYVGAHYLSDVVAGAAFGWAIMALAWKIVPVVRLEIEQSEAPARHSLLALLMTLVVLGWSFKQEALYVDGLSLRRIEAIERLGSLPRLLLEPLFGPAAKLSSLPDLPAAGIGGGILLVLAYLAALVWRRPARRAAAALALGLFGWAGAVVFLALGDRPVQDGLRMPDEGPSRRWIAVDLHGHAGDPVDGHVGPEAASRRGGALGFSLLARTWHNAWSESLFTDRRTQQAKAGPPLFGLEWSRGAPADSPFHLLLLARQPLPEVVGIQDWREVVRAARAAGALVIVAHFWRGEASRMPGLAEVLEAGVDGFEIANRNQDFDAEALDRLGAIRRAVVEEGLLGLANGDYHGRRAFNQGWNFVAVPDVLNWGTEDVWAALVSRPPGLRTVLRESVAPPSGCPEWAIPVWALGSYFRELSLVKRAVWLVELLLILALSRLAQRRWLDVRVGAG